MHLSKKMKTKKHTQKNPQQNQTKTKKKKKMKKRNLSNRVKSLRCIDYFSPTNTFSLLESSQPHIIAKYKAKNCCKMEAVIQVGSVKKVF